MSAYRHSMSAVQRAKKRSATGAAAYRSGTKLVDVRTGAEYDYTRRRGVAAAHLIVPGAPHIDAVDRQALWAAVEKKHARGDAVPAREVVGNIPCELDQIDGLALALRYARYFSDAYGVAADLALHLPSIKPGHDQRNTHFHMLFSACTVHADAYGLVLTCGKKVEALDPIASKRRGGEPIAEIERAVWATMCNEALAAAGRADVVVDHRSYERQGIEQQPQIHLGPDAFENLLRHKADPGNVVLLDRTRQWLEIEIGNSYLREAQRCDAEVARLEAEIIELPPPAARPDNVQGPSAVVLPLRPAAAEPPPAPDTDAVLAGVKGLWQSLDRIDGLHDDRRDSWRILRAMDRNGWRPDAPALRELLDAHPALRSEWHAELQARAPEIRVAASERAIERIAARSAERREAAKSYLVPVPSPARAPTAKTEPEQEQEQEPVARRDLPAPSLPVVRTVRDVDEAIADAEARLAALEQRERVRAAAAEGYRRAQAALKAAQSGLWARLRAWVGVASAAEIAAQTELEAAEQEVKSAGGGVIFGKVVMPAAERGEQLKRQLVALRDERGGLVAADATTAARTAAAVDQVIDLVGRADRVVPGAERAEWPALRALDAAGGIEQLRERLQRDPGLAIALAHDLGQRLPALEALESQSDRDLPLLESTESVADRLVAAIERGPMRAWPAQWIGWLTGCERRGEITLDELQQAVHVLSELPTAVEREQLARLVDGDQAPDNDQAPGM